MESETQEERSEICPSCGSLIPVANLELHSLRCERARHNAASPSRPRIVSTLCYMFLGIPVLALLTICIYLFVAWRHEVQLYRQNTALQFAMDSFPALHIFMLDRIMGNTLRKALLGRLPQSYLPDVWPESSFAWTRVLDDFWSSSSSSSPATGAKSTSLILVRPPLKDRSRLVEDSVLTAEQARQLKQDILSMTDRLDKMKWKTLPTSPGVCGKRQHHPGTLCAVHRWNMYMERNRLMGRVQCWTDLMHADPQFVLQNPLFHPALLPVAAEHDNLFYCLVDIPGYAATLAAAANNLRLLLHVNNLLWYCDDSLAAAAAAAATDEHHVPLIRQEDLPADLMRRWAEPLFFQFLDAYINDDDSAVDEEDEGGIIDLDLLDASVTTSSRSASTEEL